MCSGDLVDLVKAAAVEGEGGRAVLFLAQVEQQEFVGGAGGELVGFDVHAAHPVALAFEVCDEVAADETAGATDQGSFHACLQKNPQITQIFTDGRRNRRNGT